VTLLIGSTDREPTLTTRLVQPWPLGSIVGNDHEIEHYSQLILLWQPDAWRVVYAREEVLFAFFEVKVLTVEHAVSERKG
jgi:hypothetical protein